MGFSFRRSCVFVLFLALFGALWAERLEVLKTEYFDIIYSPASKDSAALIATHADEYAKEISARLGKKLPHRYPVYISSNSELLNGYYTLFPYQRIVIYDATVDDGELGNSYDSILNVFYHELTHAISLWYYLPTLSLSFDEGVAVLFESRGDQGRLNDPLIAHHIMQGKIDKTTPTWREAAGHRDVYPGAFWAYIYGANFLSYLENIYGKDKYIKFFHNNFFIFPKGKAKRIFDKTLEELWKDFTNSISYPKDFYEPLPFIKEKMSDIVLAQSINGFAYYNASKRGVYFCDKLQKQQKLFATPSSVTDLNFSPDGSLLLVTDVKDDWGKMKQRLSIYNVEKKQFLEQSLFSIRYACFAGKDEDGKEAICAVKVKGQDSSLVLLDTSLEKEEHLFTFGPGKPYSHIYSPVYAGEGKVAFIASNGLYRDILILNIKTKTIEKVKIEENLEAIRYLRSSIAGDDVFLTFSWAGKNMLYRMALYNMKGNSLKTLEKDISGGTFQPIVFEKDEFIKIVYAGIHGKYKTLYCLTDDSLTDKKFEIVAFNFNEKEPMSAAPNFEGLKPQKYNYFSWIWKVLPLPYLKPSSDLRSAGKWGYGMYFYGKDPTEFIEFDITPIFYFKPFFAELTADLSLDFTAFKLGFCANDSNLDFAGRSTSFSVNAISSVSLDQINKRFSFGGGLGILGSLKFPNTIETAKTLYSYSYTDSFFSVALHGRYSQIEKRYRLGTNFFAIDARGFSVSTKGNYLLHMQSKANMFVLQALGNFYVPVVPMHIKMATYYGHNAYYRPSNGAFLFVDNKSFASIGSYLPPMGEYQDISKTESVAKNNLGLSFDLSLRVFSYEIQKGSNLFLIYFNRINFELGYRSVLNLALASGVHPTYFQSVYADAYLDISGMVKLGVRYSHPLERDASFGKFTMLFNADIFF